MAYKSKGFTAFGEVTGGKLVGSGVFLYTPHPE